MSREKIALKGLAFGGALSAVVAGLIASGCSSDNGTPGDGGTDSAADHTGSSSSGASSSSGSGGSSGSSSSGSSSSGGSSSGSSSSGSSSGGPDGGPRNDAGDGGPTDGGSHPEGGGGACTTSIGQFVAPSDAGAPDAASDAGADAGGPVTPRLLFGFDNGSNLGWGGSQDTNSTVSLGAVLNDGHACPGALSMYATFSGYGAQPQVLYNYNSNPPYAPANWTGFTKLHIWVKVLTADFTTLNGLQAFVQSNSFAPGYYRQTFTGVGTTLADGGKLSDGVWHQIIVDLTPLTADGGMNNYAPGIVNQFGIQVATQGTAADGGPVAPPPATLLVDDIWIE